MTAAAAIPVAEPRPRDDAAGSAGHRTVLIVDDHRSFAELLAAALGNVPGFSCVGIAATASHGVALAAELRPSLVVMDIQMPGQDGLVATRRIREVAPDSVVAVVTAHHDPRWVSGAAQAGASAFIPKDGSLAEMIDLLGRVRHGQMLVGPTLFRAQLDAVAPPEDDAVPMLSHRELAVLTHLAQGLKVQGIARALGISVHTCRGYVKTMHTKMGVRTQLEAVIKANQLGMLGLHR
jgi:DNA-binding NarL/FixJ family response regulator